ncbi:hypothetical protein DRW03_32570 [Corallococcus sp. H22C18031201]|uniref:hypothetical protein n=1 Tax=Citreicoccus inhibens TaxID=2849499 RepID=UPI000E7468EA|nr:hypothetical protein [Citreicoccus inhibens]MBU8897983.1 hypothetical protein [Citreicoccus inhibens]RJS15814.1 hypothetical protein DRW03_32570 [Corallococcus sp. H22C18031201]
MRFKKLGEEDVGESASLRHVNPDTGEEEINVTDQELAMTPPLEEEADFRDILPDQIHEFRRGDEAEQAGEITAQPDERIRPMESDQLPEG